VSGFRPALSVEAAVEVMKRGRGTHFDPRIVDALLDHLEQAPFASRLVCVLGPTQRRSAQAQIVMVGR
jgi:HD-GYP domain-containing protein (c-di-GMP phosphodiesterase class II)